VQRRGILLDEEQFKAVSGSYGSTLIPDIPVGGNKQVLEANLGNVIEMKKNGYLYVYVSNESKMNVYFDDIHVEHERGALLEETHYYAWGLVMKGISSKAMSFGGVENKCKYNGKEEQREEFSDGSGLEWLDYGARMYDSQVARWMVVDAKVDKWVGVTPYCYAINDPLKFIDPDGKDLIVAARNPDDTKSVEQFTGYVNDALGGFYRVKSTTDADGVTSMRLVRSQDAKGKMTKAQQEFFNSVKDAFNGSEDVLVALDQGNQQYITGDVQDGQVHAIDMSDVKQFDKGKGIVSITGALGHEINEAYNVQVKGVAPKDAHEKKGIPAEDAINGSKRNEDAKLPGSTYNKKTGTGVINQQYSKNGVTYTVSFVVNKNNITNIVVTEEQKKKN
jgi:RHS repeat-associated protein